MNKVFNTRLDNTSKMLLHWVQDVRRSVKQGDAANSVRAAREVLNMAGWVLTYASALLTLKNANGKEQE